jgi:hypothetical protein
MIVSLSWKCPLCLVGDLSILCSSDSKNRFVYCDEEMYLWEYATFLDGELNHFLVEEQAFPSNERIIKIGVSAISKHQNIIEKIVLETNSDTLVAENETGNFYLVASEKLESELNSDYLGIASSKNRPLIRIFPVSKKNLNILFSDAVFALPV